MPEFLTLLAPDEARELFFSHIQPGSMPAESIETVHALGRVTAEAVIAPHSLPEFIRSTVDGYAVRARDTYGASDSQPGYLSLIGEIPMGIAPALSLSAGQCCLIHTGGMLPDGSDAVIMLENTQPVSTGDQAKAGAVLEIYRPAASGENLILEGEDVRQGQAVIPAGRRLRPAEIGGLMALGITQVLAAAIPRVGLISSGDELCDPAQSTLPGQVRDVNAYSLGALITSCGGEPVYYGIVPDIRSELESTTRKALAECDAVLITAGSSASTRDMTAEVIGLLGAPGVLVHGINSRPGKPTILGVCDGKPVIGLPGNPVSALVNGWLFVKPLIERLLGQSRSLRPSVQGRLTVNVPSQAGREDWIPVRLLPAAAGKSTAGYDAVPIFGKSNLIFNLADADGLLRIPPDITGYEAGVITDIFLL